MNERQTLLRAIIDNPDDDGPRLVYSDWLEEHGETEADRARAAFIRLQVETARLDDYDPRRLDLEGQAEALLNAHREAWLAGLEKWMVNHHFTSFERGFPFVVMATVNELLDRGDELWAAAPFRLLDIWEGWRDDGGGSRFSALAGYAPLARIRRLRLNGVPSSVDGLAPLLASPHLAALDDLGLYPPSDQPWLQALLASPLQRPLTGLSLATYHPWADMRALVATGLLGRLRTLSVYGRQPWGAEASQALAAAPTDRLEGLGLLAAQLDGPALRALLASPPLKALQRLHIANNRFTPDAVAALVELLESDRLPRLTSLHLTYNSGVNAAGAAILAACSGLARLRELDLTGNSIRNNGARALAASPHLAGLLVLRLGSNGIPGTAARALADSPYLAGLRVLDLCGNPIPESAEKAINRRLGPGVVR